MESYPSELLLIAFVAMLAPLLTELPKGFRIPVVVLEIILGILIGPQAFNLATPDGMIGTLGELGLTFLLFMVGLEIDFDKIRGRPLSLAVGGWFLSLAVALLCMFFFSAIGLIQTPPLLAAIALSTTAVGILAPILKDRGELNTDFGKYLVAAAAVGEFGPLVIISMLLIPSHSTFVHTLFILTFVSIAFVAANIALNARPSKLIELLKKTMQSSGQLPVRICILLQILFVALAAKFGLNIVMGAFTAGIVVSLAIKGTDGELLRHKLDAIGYGFLIPIFFIVAGMKFEVSALWSAPLAPIQVMLLLLLLVLVRGVPVLLYKKELTPDEKLPFAFYSATGLPLIVIISEIGVSSGVMPPDRAAILVCAGMLSVLLFPILAVKLRGKFKLP
ncbi:MAG: cation:proton antiporter [Methylococcaceae bacterium]|nr:cation:proton antiporter [Methylococcaceae bacterium]MDZ4156329.1 cation:proton antiporter [Methylococcales bacterium]MDP2394590.1 cation:proton antiporter [Methylococcaceae bacterium]MDP3019058.1 cation:proton antiporter [Methylococcaceae bacterium]MDP3390274.1 cation:proton antiporter [Methylococcaceae bacterium]